MENAQRGVKEISTSLINRVDILKIILHRNLSTHISSYFMFNAELHIFSRQDYLLNLQIESCFEHISTCKFEFGSCNFKDQDVCKRYTILHKDNNYITFFIILAISAIWVRVKPNLTVTIFDALYTGLAAVS